MEADEATDPVGTNPTGGGADAVATAGALPPPVMDQHHLEGEEERPDGGGAAPAAAALLRDEDHGGVGRRQQGGGKPAGVVPVSIITVDTSAPPLPSSLSKEDSLSSERGPHDHHDDAEEEEGDGGLRGRPPPAAGGGTPLKGTPLKGSHDAAGSHHLHQGQASHQARTPKHANRTEEGSKSWDDAATAQGGSTAAASLQHHAHPQLHHSHPHHPSQQPPPYHHPGPPFHSNSFPPPPPPSSAASSRSTSAFHHPHDRPGPPPPYQQQPPPHPQQRTTVPMQVSPGSSGGRYYQYTHAGPPRYGHPPMPPYEPPHQPYHAGGYRPAPPAYGGPYGGGGPVPYGHPPPYADGGGGGGGYEGGGPTWGRPPSYPNNGPPHPPPPPHEYHAQGPGPLPPSSHHPPHHAHSHGGGPPPLHHSPQQPPILQSPNSSDNFSRAVSSSFDRSIKSHDHNATAATKSHHRESGEAYHQHRHASQHRGGGLVVDAPPPADATEGTDPTADDASWGQLNQVASVDEDEMRKRLAKDRRERRHHQHHSRRHHGEHRRAETPDGEDDGGDDVGVTRSASNSSSLTNSPTDGVLKPAARLRAHLQEQPPLPAAADDEHALPANSTNSNVRIHSSLDSLSSVASEQALIAANKDLLTSASPARHHQHHRRRSSHSAQPLSPQGSTTSLDLLKCASGSTALLLPRHDDPDGPYHSVDKRGHPHEDDDEEEGDDEDRGDEDTKMEASELRKAPSAEDSLMHLGTHPHHRRRYPDNDAAGMISGPPKKRNRADMDPHHRKEGLKKSSPLSIECSPPNSPTLDKRKSEYLHKAGRFNQPQQAPTSVDSYYDKPPQYTYSLESAPPLPRDPATTQRPESTSSTITPMNVDGEEIPIPPPPPQIHHHAEPRSHHHHGHAPHPSIGQFPSWEIHHQDSFGANSAGGEGGTAAGGGHGTLMNSFSFTQEYPGLSANASADHGGALERGSGGGGHGPPAHSHQHQHPALESRNQSFEGGHYHGGGFARSDSMMSYEHQGGPPPPPMYDRGGQGGYHGPFPPQAPSWGSASSYPHGGHYYPTGGYPPPPMRNYSDDSGGGRASPPPHHGHRGGGGFQPPPDFRAPPSLVPKAGPSQSQQLILSSPYTATSKAGAYGWSKEEDMRLTDIMKKYKNPRDWEPIAKEHNCGRSAKECHERWIRYLKPGVRKGQWTDHEDAIVMEVVTTSTEQPFTRWSDLAQRLPGRVGKQIRDRWVNHLNPNINHLPFSREDDLLLWEGHKKLGKRWVEISTKYFETNRSENHIKNRWYSASFKKFIANEFGVDAYSGKKDASSPKRKHQSSNSSSTTPKDKAPPLTPSSLTGSSSPTKRTPAPADVMQCEEV